MSLCRLRPGPSRYVRSIALPPFPFLTPTPTSHTPTLPAFLQRTHAPCYISASGKDLDHTNGNDRRTDDDHPASLPRLRQERLQAWAEYQHALAGEGKLRINTVGADAKDGRKSDEKGNSKSGKPDPDRGVYREYGGIGVIMLDVWGNQPWGLDEKGMNSVKGGDAPGFHPKALLSKR